MRSVRSYQPGDEAVLVDLANRAYAPYGGHVPRTRELWRWSILSRPGLDPQDILLLTDRGGEACGYGVLGKDGVVLEFCLEPDLTGEERERAAGLLVSALEERCRVRGLEAITFELPRIDGRVRAALLSDGYRDEESESLQVILVDVAEALRRILQHRQGRIPHGWSPTFLLAITPGHYRRSQPITRIRVKPGEQIEVEENPPADLEVDITVTIDLSTLTDIILRRDSFEEARTGGRIAVEPAAGEQDARTLFDWLGLRNPWYTPPADGR